MRGSRYSRRAVLVGGVALKAGAGGARAQTAPDVRILVPNTLLGQTADSFTSAFTKLTGATVAYIPQPPDSIEFLLREDVRTGTNRYQGAIVPMWHLGGFVVDSIIRPLDDLIAAMGVPDQQQGVEFEPISRLRHFEGEQYALAIDGDCQVLYFQDDVFQSDQIAQRFESETGRPFEPSATWHDLLHIAEWWSAQGQRGVALHLAPSSLAVLPFLGMAAPYATPFEDPSLFWFDRESFAPMIASEDHQRALEDFARLAATGDSSQTTWYLPDGWSAFLDGQALFTISGPDLITSAIDRNHSRRDRIGMAPLPGLAAQSGTPSSGDRGSSVGNALGPCWGGVVQANAPDPGLALRALAFLSEPGFQMNRGWIVDDGIDPSRLGQLAGDGAISFDDYTAAGFTQRQTTQFGYAVDGALREEIQLPYLRIPGALDYLSALDRSVTGYFAGAFGNARDALETAAAAFDALSERHGVERQQFLYFSDEN